MSYTTIIGLEVHVQLLTRSKLFCGCANRFNPDHPNVQTCPVCLGMPGSLPVMNERAFHLAVKTALALNCEIARYTKWDRKQYYYPDLPKGYQISQYDLPFSQHGHLDVDSDLLERDQRKVRILRVHLEEDAGKNMHDESGRGGDSQVDLNRAGTPLLEIVSEPDLRSAAEARRYLEELRLILTYLGVSDCNMQEGSLRCDANVNLHVDEAGEKIATPIVEIKNLNSFRNVEMAIHYEVERQWQDWQETGQTLKEVGKQTRGWNAERGFTFGQRGKEEESDYRYFPDPDLVPVTVSEAQLAGIHSELCELPPARRQRFQTELELSDYDASVIIDQGAAFADYFEQVAAGCGNAKQAANWVTQDVQRELNQQQRDIEGFAITAELLAALLRKIEANEISTKGARDVFAALVEMEHAAQTPSLDALDQIIADQGLALVSDMSQFDGIIASVIAKNEKAVQDFKAGKPAAIGPLIGQVMKEAKGADPKRIRQQIIEQLEKQP